MTAAGHLVLEAELKHRIQVERPRLIKRIQDAIADNFNLPKNRVDGAHDAEMGRKHFLIEGKASGLTVPSGAASAALR